MSPTCWSGTDDTIICIIIKEEEIDETEDVNNENEKIILHAEDTAALNFSTLYGEATKCTAREFLLKIKQL